MKKVFVYKNEVKKSLEIAEILKGKLKDAGIVTVNDPDDADLIF